MKKNRWYCANCIVCEVCGLSDDVSLEYNLSRSPALSAFPQLFECAQCHSHFHSGCLSSDHPVGLPQDDLWRCSTCVKCTGCGAISSGDVTIFFRSHYRLILYWDVCVCIGQRQRLVRRSDSLWRLHVVEEEKCFYYFS